MKTFLIILFCLFAVSCLGNIWQHKNPEIRTETVTDTLIVFEVLPPDTVISEVIKYKRITITDTLKLDSLQTLLDSVICELNKGEIRIYTDTTVFYTGDSLHTTIKGILFDKVFYAFFPVPKETKIVNIYKDSRDEVWFTLVPSLGIKVNGGNMFMDADLALQFRSFGIGATFGLDVNNLSFYKGVKVSKIIEVPKIKFF